MALKHHGGRVAVQNSQSTRELTRSREAQARLADKSFTQFMREHNKRQGTR